MGSTPWLWNITHPAASGPWIQSQQQIIPEAAVMLPCLAVEPTECDIFQDIYGNPQYAYQKNLLPNNKNNEFNIDECIHVSHLCLS